MIQELDYFATFVNSIVEIRDSVNDLTVALYVVGGFLGLILVLSFIYNLGRNAKK